MERINQFAFYELGRALKQIATFRGDIHPTQVFSEVFAASSAVNQLLGGNPMPLGVSRGSALRLADSINHVMHQYYHETAADGTRIFRFPTEQDAAIGGFCWDWIRNSLQSFEIVFGEEMRQAAAYFVPQRGIYDTPSLVDSADQSFPTELASKIPQKTKDDWRAAGRCLAFNLLSASGFHVARAVEGILEAYYQFYCRKPESTLKSFYDYHKALENQRRSGVAPCPSERMLAELDQMRNDYRNPIMHPRVVLSEADARMLFANGESLIILMAQELLTADNYCKDAQADPGLPSPI